MCVEAFLSSFAFVPLEGLFFPAAVSKLHAYQAFKAKGQNVWKGKQKHKDASFYQDLFFQHVWCQWPSLKLGMDDAFDLAHAFTTTP